MSSQIPDIKFDRPSVTSTRNQPASHFGTNTTRSAQKNALPRSGPLPTRLA